MTFPNVIIVGATGNVGRITTQIILSRGIVPPHHIHLVGSQKSVGQKIMSSGYSFTVSRLQDITLKKNDICIFNTENSVSQEYIPMALESGCYVIDSSSHYRLTDTVPLIVPTVNSHHITAETYLYAHPNCITSPLATVLAPLHHQIGIKRVSVTTYQSTSGAGKVAMDECLAETHHHIQSWPYTRLHFNKQIAFNIIPQIGVMGDNGETTEEFKIIHELQKVLEAPIKITATAVRVPVMIGHSSAVTIQFQKKFSIDAIYTLLNNSVSVQVNNQEYTTPIECVGSDDVFVGRIRLDYSMNNSLHLWLCSDNLRRGAATDCVDIAEIICQKN